MKKYRIFLFFLLGISPLFLFAQKKNKRARNAPSAVFDAEVFKSLQFRNIGPFRGGRSNAVSGVRGDDQTYYFGSVGGGVWKTTDAGISWKNVTDGFLASGSVGAIAVAPSDANVVYVGMGEHAVRGVMTSHGDGMYKSTDAGKTWSHIGLKDARHIAAIRVHPTNPDVVFVAVQGALWGPSADRGVYKTTDGGQTWRKVLFVNETTGAADLSMDATNPRILYAGMWDHQRFPWQVRSGGPGSGIWKSVDGGETWQALKKGLPEAMGKVAVDVSPANPNRVYANIEAEKGGVYRSDDGGKSWKRVNSDRVTVARAWYYIEIFAHPTDENIVYVLNAPVLRSIDGGKTFESVPNPHSDQHDLWINPDRPDNMILANDGGACITFNAGRSWSTQQNQPTAQFYRVIADRRFPYHLYGGQQDNSTVCIASRTSGGGIGVRDWYPVSGGESAFLAFDPDHPDLVYGNSIQGFMEVYDHKTGETKGIMAYPQLNLGTLPRDMKYRFNWNNPLVADPHDPTVLYHGAQLVLKSADGGYSWTEISPDLTRNDPEKHNAGGVPYTNEAAGGEVYNTLSYLACSPKEAGVIWAGSDDGLVHLTRDGGKNWANVTPAGLPESLINAIEVSPHDPATAYLAVTRYKWNDLAPMIFVTHDYGKTWSKKVAGIPGDNFVRVVREDPVKKGLLYAGTEHGLYVSFDGGEKWSRFQSNLPVCPITDLAVHDNDLLVATSGRAFW
ncbi:MAG: glycosyl hydrolase, partial [Bacteroidetes bacterium]